MKTIKFKLQNELQDYSWHMDCALTSHLFEKLKKEENNWQPDITIVLKTPELEKFIQDAEIADYTEISEQEYDEFIWDEVFWFFSVDFKFINSASLPTSMEEVYYNQVKRFYKKEFINIKNGQKTLAGNLFFVVYNGLFFGQDWTHLSSEDYKKISDIFCINSKQNALQNFSDIFCIKTLVQ